MKWELVDQEMAAAFKTVKVEADGACVLVPDAPLDLQEAFRGAEEPGDREHSELSEYLIDESDSCDVRGLLEHHWPLSPLLGFDWASIGAMSWYATLDMLDLGDRRAAVGLNQEEQEYLIFALVDGGTAGWSLLFPDLCATNGNSYSVGLFGSLPSKTENYGPGLVSQTVVREGYRGWLDHQDDGWWLFEEAVVKYAAGAAHSSPVERALAEGEVDFDFVDSAPKPNDDYDHDRRRFLLDLYFTHNYREP